MMLATRHSVGVHAIRFVILFCVGVSFLNRSAIGQQGKVSGGPVSVLELTDDQLRSSLTPDQLAVLDEICGKLAAVKESAEPLSADVLLTVMSDHPVLMPQQRILILRTFESLQSAPYAKSDVLEIIRSTRDSLSEIDSHVTLTFQVAPPVEQTDYSKPSQYRFAMSEGRYLFEQWYHSPEHGSIHSIRSYDGQLVRTVQDLPALANPAGGITALDSKSPFFHIWSNILAATMLLDSTSIEGQALPYYDLVALLSMPDTVFLSNTELIDGEECIIATNVNLDVYLCVESGFMPRRFAAYEVDNTRGVQRGRRRSVVREFSSWKDFDKSIRLPTVVKEQRFSSDKTTLDFTLTVDELQVNHPIAESVFADVIPPGSFVSDSIRNLVYVSGKDNSIAEMISRNSGTANISRNNRPMWLMAINVGIAALILLFYRFRRTPRLK